MLREALFVSFCLELCASKISYVHQNAGYVFVAEDVLVVLGGKHQVSVWKRSSTGCACGQELRGGTGHCCSVVTSTAVLRCFTGEAAGLQSCSAWRVSLSWPSRRREVQSCQHEPVPGLSEVKGCEEPVCANLCQTH